MSQPAGRTIRLVYVAYARELHAESNRARTLAATILKRASGIAAISRFTSSEIARRYPHSVPIELIYSGVDLDRFRPARGRAAAHLDPRGEPTAQTGP